MKRRHLAALPLLTVSLVLAMTTSSLGQVATLATPDPDAAASAAPFEEVDGEQAILDVVACLRDNGLDLPDPQFGPEGVRFADPSAMMGIDFRSSEFLDAMEACDDLLAALQPEVDPEQQAEQVEQQVAFAECMRGEGIDFPDPDPVRGFSIGNMRGADGGMAIDPFSSDFQAASEVCFAEIGAEPPAGPGSQ